MENNTKEKTIIHLESDCEEVLVLDDSVISIPDSSYALDNTQSELEATNEISEFSSEKLLFEVKFKSSEIFNELKDLVLNSLQETFKDKTGVSIVEDDETIQVLREHEESIEEDDSAEGLFTIDTLPAAKVDTVQIPSYKRTTTGLLDVSSSKKKKNDDDCQRPKSTKSCFNCGETNHDLRSCPRPRNMTKINKAKKRHSTRQERYHVDIEQRFAHLRPGKISSNLREALGIRGGELPFFFYRMRVLGYPPGWLEDAKVEHSGICLFDSEGHSVRDPEEEEGEVDSEKHKYDTSKIIGFPGFNEDPGPNFYDDFKHHNVPPLNPEIYKDKFIAMLGDNVAKGYKRKKLRDLPGSDSIEKHSIEQSEMEIEDDDNIPSTKNVEFTRPPPPNTPPPEIESAPPLPPSPKTSLSPKRSPSPSLEDLEERQKRLLRELESNITIVSDNDDSLIDEVIELEKTTTISSTEKSDKLETVIEPETNSKQLNSSLVNSSSQPTTPHTVESVLGTPLLKFSPFEKLPCGDNFKVGVSDVINFENLPDSTGTYEKMKGVIKKVRTVVTQLYSEES